MKEKDQMKKFILFFLISFSAAFAQVSEPTCYSVQLISGSNLYSNTKLQSFVDDEACRIFTINRKQTLRCGCYVKKKPAKKILKWFRKSFSDAIVVETYRYRFFNNVTLILSEFSEENEAKKAYTQIMAMLPPSADPQNLTIEKKEKLYTVALKNLTSTAQRARVTAYLQSRYLETLNETKISAANALSQEKKSQSVSEKPAEQNQFELNHATSLKLAHSYYLADDFDNAASHLKSMPKGSASYEKPQMQQQYLHTIENRKNNSIFTPYISLGVGYDDNILNDTQLYTKKEGIEKRASAFTHGILSIGHIYGYEKTRYSYESIVNIQHRYAFSTNDARLFDASLLTGPSYRYANKKLFLGLHAQRINYGGDLSYNVFGIEPQFDYRLTSTLRLLLEGNLLNYNDISENNRDFNYQDVIADLTEQWGDNAVEGVLSFANVDKMSSDAKDIDRKIFSFSAIYTRRLFSSVSWMFNAEYSAINYDESNPNTDQRRDKAAEFGTTLFATINNTIDLSLEYNYIKNSSNDAEYNYHKNTIQTNIDLHY